MRTALDATVISVDEINAQRGLPFGGEGLPESLWAETLTVPADDALVLQRREQLAPSAARPVLGRHRLLQHLAGFEWPTEDEQPIKLPPAADVLQVLGRLNSRTGEPLKEVCSNA